MTGIFDGHRLHRRVPWIAARRYERGYEFAGHIQPHLHDLESSP
jgi:hypothetical protein